MFLGKAWEHIRWGGHFRDFYYNPQGFGGWFAEFLGISFKQFYNDHFYEHILLYFADGVGVLFLLSAVVISFYERLSKFKWLIYIAMFFLLISYLGLFMSKHFEQWGMLFEHSSQFVFPILFMLYYHKREKPFYYLGVASIALTFLCHGLYAVGYYPQPGNYADMMIVGFHITEDTARQALIYIGYLDFIFSLLVLYPVFSFSNKIGLRIVKGALIYGFVWGFVTAFARVYVTFDAVMVLHWMDQYWMEFLIRIPHFIVPFVLWKRI